MRSFYKYGHPLPDSPVNGFLGAMIQRFPVTDRRVIDVQVVHVFLAPRILSSPSIHY